MKTGAAEVVDAEGARTFLQQMIVAYFPDAKAVGKVVVERPDYVVVATLCELSGTRLGTLADRRASFLEAFHWGLSSGAALVVAGGGGGAAVAVVAVTYAAFAAAAAADVA